MERCFQNLKNNMQTNALLFGKSLIINQLKIVYFQLIIYA